jgi:hypothetical protein
MDLAHLLQFVILALNKNSGGFKMKKVLSTLVAALVAVSFAGLVSAAEVKTNEKTETTTTSPSGEVKVEKKKVKKTVKKHKKVKKVVTEETPTTTTTTTTTPDAK